MLTLKNNSGAHVSRERETRETYRTIFLAVEMIVFPSDGKYLEKQRCGVCERNFVASGSV